MKNDGSVAPKERVNIVYKSDVGDIEEMVEIPLKLMVLGDFTLRADEQPVEKRKPINIDNRNFDDVMRGQNLSMDLEVADKLTGKKDKPISVTLKFDSMEDFKPDNIAAQVPEIKKNVDLRQALLAVKGPLGNMPALRKSIQKIMDNDKERANLIKELGDLTAK